MIQASSAAVLDVHDAAQHRVRTLDPRSMQSVVLIFVLDYHKNVFRVVMMLVVLSIVDEHERLSFFDHVN